MYLEPLKNLTDSYWRINENESDKWYKTQIQGVGSWTMFDFSDLFPNWLAVSVACRIKLRPHLYRIDGNKIGKRCYLSPRIFLGSGPGKLYVDEQNFINYNCWFDLSNDIRIGNR